MITLTTHRMIWKDKSGQVIVRSLSDGYFSKFILD